MGAAVMAKGIGGKVLLVGLVLIGGAIGLYGRSALEEMREPQVAAPSPLTPELLDTVDARIRAQRGY